jgi:outer membrane lipoprotein-sorting protein
MYFLRTVTTRRLLALIAGLVVAIAGGTAIAVAASSGGPVPRHKPLAQAIHSALAAPAVSGISADITFTNHLIDASNIQGSDPILSGAKGRLWLTGDHRFRLELQSDNGDAQVVVNHGSFWVYDPASNTVYRGKLPADTKARTSARHEALPTIADIQKQLADLMSHASLSGAIPGDVAGQPAYTVRISPKHDGGLLGAGELAWDAIKGVPLRVAVYARGDNSPVLELKATGVTYGRVKNSVFNVSPPSDAKVVQVATPSGKATAAAHGRGAHRQREVAGAAAVARNVPFHLVAPRTLVGVPRRSATLLDWGGHPAALLAYGQNLGGIAVIEQTATNGGTVAKPQGDHAGLSLPTVSIGKTSGQELDTALGTMVRFTRGGVTYTVIGSVPPAAAEAAARSL